MPTADVPAPWDLGPWVPKSPQAQAQPSTPRQPPNPAPGTCSLPTWKLTSPPRTQTPPHLCWHSRSLPGRREPRGEAPPSPPPPSHPSPSGIGLRPLGSLGEGGSLRREAGSPGGPWGPRGLPPPCTLLHVVDEGLQLGMGLGLLAQGVKQQVVLGGARYVCLPQPSLQQPDLGLLLGHLQPLRAGSKEAWGYPSWPGAGGAPVTALPGSAPNQTPPR